ncbi:MAG: ABC transporter substrate-binding protein [Synergistetes bacterium]|nr:ABC transporter substrate-binding protein [Synergistota bacterium]MDK2871342.1 branched-chain amino acid transport system substrate-binding protein [bacterium]
MKRLWLLVVIGLVFSSFSVAWAEDKIRIGVVMPMTGPVAAYGQMEWAGIQVAKELVPTVLGKEIELVLVDSKGDKVEGANAVERLIKLEKVCSIIGEVTSSVTMSGGAVAEQYKVPMISPTATNPLVTQDKKYLFRVCFIDPFQGKIAAKYAYDVLKVRKVAIVIDVQQDYCVGLANFFEENFKKLGGEVVAKVQYRTGDQDFTAQVTAVKAKNPDMIYIPGYYNEIALFTKQARELGVKSIVFSADGSYAPELIQIGGKAVEGIYFTNFYDQSAVTTDIGKKFVEAYRKKYGKDTDSFAALAAEAYLVLVHAIEKAGEPDPEKIRDALEGIKSFTGFMGEFGFDENHNAIRPVVIQTVKDGKFAYVDIVKP